MGILRTQCSKWNLTKRLYRGLHNVDVKDMNKQKKNPQFSVKTRSLRFLTSLNQQMLSKQKVNSFLKSFRKRTVSSCDKMNDTERYFLNRMKDLKKQIILMNIFFWGCRFCFSNPAVIQQFYKWGSDRYKFYVLSF